LCAAVLLNRRANRNLALPYYRAARRPREVNFAQAHVARRARSDMARSKR
jgi:hypothetical protein